MKEKYGGISSCKCLEHSHLRFSAVIYCSIRVSFNEVLFDPRLTNLHTPLVTS